jgi:hypothetical protein
VLPAVHDPPALTAHQLFGEEIVLMLIGLSWPPLTGMAIGAAGMLLGELGAFLLCKSLLRARAARYEARNLEYALVAHVIRSGGLVVAVLVRYSLLSDPRACASSDTRPAAAHARAVITALFAACGVGPGTFALSAVLALPNQLVNVYVGYDTKLQTLGRTWSADARQPWC